MKSFNEKCDSILIYLKELADKRQDVMELIRSDKLKSDLGIDINDPAFGYLCNDKKFIDLDRKSGYFQISSAGMAFISHSSFVDIQKTKEEDVQLKWYETQNAKDVFDNFSTTQRNSKLALIIAVLSAILTLIGLMKK